MQWFLNISDSLIRRARRILMGAHQRLATEPTESRFCIFQALPFDSRYNIYDVIVADGIERLVKSKGEDKHVLAELVNLAVGRHIYPESPDEEIAQLKLRVRELEKRLGGA